jgi:xanthine dehydrogenase YagS FAD-binding subunit
LGGEICQRPQCWFFRNGQGLLSDDRFGEPSSADGRAADGDNRFHAIFGNAGPAKYVSSSRIAPALIALQARVRIVGPKPDAEQWVALADFFRTPRHAGQGETVLQPRQLVTHIVLPPTQSGNATYEVRHGEGPYFPLAAAAAALDLQGSVVQQARVVLGQVAPVPWICGDAADLLRGLSITRDVAAAAGEVAVASATPLSNNQYKVQLAKVAVQRAILLAAGLETGGF